MPAEPAAESTTHPPSPWPSTQLAVLAGKVDEYHLTGKLDGLVKKQARKELLIDVYKALKPLHPKQTTAEWAKVKMVYDTCPSGLNCSW
jgi:hypothetical protein